jgi:hypothetical protein
LPSQIIDDCFYSTGKKIQLYLLNYTKQTVSVKILAKRKISESNFECRCAQRRNLITKNSLGERMRNRFVYQALILNNQA